MNSVRKLNSTFTNTGAAPTAGLPGFLCETTAWRNDGEACVVSECVSARHMTWLTRRSRPSEWWRRNPVHNGCVMRRQTVTNSCGSTVLVTTWVFDLKVSARKPDRGSVAMGNVNPTAGARKRLSSGWDLPLPEPAFSQRRGWTLRRCCICCCCLRELCPHPA